MSDSKLPNSDPTPFSVPQRVSESPIVTLTTDFGWGSYVAQMKGVLLGYRRDIQIIDVAHAIPPQDVLAGALVLEDVTPRFPPDTLHLAVVDPGVGTDRSLIYAEIGAWRYLAPDNGLLSLLATRWPLVRAIRLTESQYWAKEVSRTFHGRDIIAVVAGHLLQGLDPIRLGELIPQLTPLKVAMPRQEGNRLIGEIILIDHFGNAITNLRSEVLQRVADRGGWESSRWEIQLGGNHPRENEMNSSRGERGECRFVWVPSYGHASPGTEVVLFDSQGRLELATVNGNVAEKFGLHVGQPVLVVPPSDFC